MLRWSVFALSTCRTGIHAQSCTPIILIFFFADSSVWSMVNAQLIETTVVQHRRWNWPLFVNREIEFRSVIVPVLCTRPLCCVLHADLIRKANLLRVWNKQLIHKLQTVQNNSARLIVELLNLIIYLPSFTLLTGFLLNKELNTNCFSLPINL